MQLVDGDTGEILPSTELAAMQARLEKLEGDLKGAEKDLRAKRRIISELQRDRAQERLQHPHYALIRRVCRYWHAKCRGSDPRVNPMTPDRFDAVAALTEMERIVRDEDAPRKKRREWLYELEHFKAAIDGAYFDHYVSKRRNGSDCHHWDLELICRGAAKFDEFIARCPHPVVPIAPARETPNALALRPVTRNNPSEVPNHPLPGQGGGRQLEGSDGSSCVGMRAGRFPGHVETGGLVVRGRLAVGLARESAA